MLRPAPRVCTLSGVVFCLALVLTLCELLVTVTALPPSTTCGAAGSEVYYQCQFTAYQDRLGKAYTDVDEAAVRYTIFKNNLAYIDAFNIASTTTLRLGFTPFTDMTNEEYQAAVLMSNLVKNGTIATDGPCAGPWDFEGSPQSSFDARSKATNWTIKTQRTCGDCWAFGAVASMELARMSHVDSFVYNPLSEQMLLDCSDADPNKDCATGGYPDEAMAWAYTNGICSLAEYPDTDVDQTCASSKCAQPLYRPTGCGWFDPNDYNIQSATGGFYLGTITPLNASSHNFQFYSEGVLSAQDCGSSTGANHTPLVIGWDTDSSDGDYWIVRNSWGADWGESGYVRLQRGNTNTCNMQYYSALASNLFPFQSLENGTYIVGQYTATLQRK